MTHKERILSAIRRRDIDRVPHATYNIHPYKGGHHASDPSYAGILSQIRKTAGVAVKVGGDRVGVGLSAPCEGAADTSVQLLERERVVTTTVHTPRGDLTSITRIPEGCPGMVTKHLLASDDDIEKYLSLPYTPAGAHDEAIRATYDAIGDHGVVFVCYSEPMYSTASLLHFEDFCIRCLTDLPSIKRMVDWSFERCVENTKRLASACSGMDVILHTSGPEVCTPPMLPPAIFAELVTPYLTELTRIIHEAGLLSAIHCHGRVRHVFPEIIKTGADLLEPIEPEPQGDISLAELMDQADGRIALMGHVQDQEFYTAEPGHMTAWVEHVAKVVGGRTGYIMSPTCTPFDMPCSPTYQRNYIEWLQAADRMA